MVFKILVLVLFIAATVTAAPQPSSSATDVNRNDNCETQLAQCDRIAHDLRKQKVRAEAACLKLKFQLWRLGMQHTQLEDEIVILRSQIEHPNSGRGFSGRRVRGFTVQRAYSQEGLHGNPNCTIRLNFCERSQEQQRLDLTNINADITNCTSRIEGQTRANNELIATKTSLKNQLVAQGMTIHWAADKALENPSSAEYNIDDAEVEERVAASVVTPAPHSSH
ncbi:hypothetical protein B566_EDAN000634 [Ephemera danica]|nr:hypothetical protein B566_EDAN000634 [Ephemera danica]